MDERTAEQLQADIDVRRLTIRHLLDTVAYVEREQDRDMELLRQAYERKAKGERDEH